MTLRELVQDQELRERHTRIANNLRGMLIKRLQQIDSHIVLEVIKDTPDADVVAVTKEMRKEVIEAIRACASFNGNFNEMLALDIDRIAALCGFEIRVGMMGADLFYRALTADEVPEPFLGDRELAEQIVAKLDTKKGATPHE